MKATVDCSFGIITGVDVFSANEKKPPSPTALAMAEVAAWFVNRESRLGQRI